MKTTNKFILFCLLLTSFLSLNYMCISGTDTLAYYSDVESSTGNTLIAGVWNNSASSAGSDFVNNNDLSVDNESFNNSESSNSNKSFNNSDFSVSIEADLLEVLNSVLVTSSEKQEQSHWELNVKGVPNITIDKIQVWWNNSQDNNSHMTKISIKESEIFNGNTSSGEVIDRINYSFNSEDVVKIESYFDSNVSYLAPLAINITMRDGSVKNYVTA